MLIAWSEALSVGHPLIDEDHKKLVALVNKLNDAMSERRGKEVVGQVLKELADYTVYHFNHEETLQRQGNYPGYTEHKAKHDALIVQVKDLLAKVESGDLSVTVSVMGFLKDWLTNHIMQEDKKVAAYITGK